MSVTLVTGALGNIGSRVVSNLVKAEGRVRALVRRPDAAAAKLGPSVEAVTGAYDDAAALRAAMAGVSKAVFITAGPALAKADAALAEAAKAAGVRHVVKLSVYGARHGASEIPGWHRAGEESIEASGIPWTFVRPGSFASNALGWAGSLRGTGKAFGAFGAAAIPVIHPDDIADVIALAVTAAGSSHEGKVYEIIGPEALTAAQQVGIISEVTGKSYEYVNVDDDAALRGMVGSGMPQAMAEALLHLVQSLRAAAPQLPAQPEVQRLLGQPARTFRAWVEANAAAFR
ncbi:MAG TPA: NAD(P)H-binding protein [Kofleriaceae bacterium]|nr:NAD(P)H-binding protein [Kofleriaceae bacterium]